MAGTASLPRGIDHIGITVPDIERATAFLIAAFESKVIYDTHPRTSEPQAGPDVEQRLHIAPRARIIAIRMIQLHNGPGIELFEMEGAKQAPAARPSDYGLQHFALYVDDIDAAIARFKKAGGEVYSVPHPLPPLEGRGGNLFCYGQTPWGTVVEFVTYPHPQPYCELTPLRRWTPEKLS